MLTVEARARIVQFVMEEARWTIENFVPRPPGSAGEAALQHRVREQLAGVCDGDVKMEGFAVAQKAFMAAPPLTGLLYLIAIVSFWWSQWAAVFFSGLASAVFFFEVLRYHRFIDRFFPKSTSYNVWGRRKPNGEAKRRIVFNAHPDAAYEWRWLHRFPSAFRYLVLLSFLSALKFPTDLLFLIMGGYDGAPALGDVLSILQFVLLPGALVSLLYADFRHVSPGANDNLTGMFIITGLATAMAQDNIRLQNTEIEFLLTGSEEAGLRGAKAHMREHGEEYRDVETVFVALDTFRDLDHFKVYHRDLNASVKHDAPLCRLLQKAGRNCGLGLPLGTITVGASDAAAFTQAGQRAAALCAMDPTPAHYYHNRRDHWSNMDAVCIARVVDVVVEAIDIYDRDGLPEN